MRTIHLKVDLAGADSSESNLARGANSQPDLSRLRVRISIEGSGEPILFGNTRLNAQGEAHFEGFPTGVDAVAVEVADFAGRTLFGPTILPITQDRVEVRLDPQQREGIPRPIPAAETAYSRQGHFRVFARPDYSFANHQLHVAPVSKRGAEKIVREFEDPIPNGGGWVVVDPRTLPPESLAISPAVIRFDGAFALMFPRVDNAAGWLYVLGGPRRSFVGFVPDDFSKHGGRGLVVLLPFELSASEGGPQRIAGDQRTGEAPPSGPGGDGKARCDCPQTSSSPPLDVEEAQLLENPEIFTDDPGPFCTPFQNPERILGERRFNTVLRSEQPEILGATETTFAPLPDHAIWHLLHNSRAERKVHLNPKNKSLLDARTRRRKGRQAAGAGNLIDWEEEPLTHQAISVAGGHVLEWSVRWRSNGYSLGSIQRSTNLMARQRKRIIKIEFSRREFARREEVTEIDDEVVQGSEAGRDYSDAIKANLSEWASGSSQAAAAGVAAGAGSLIGQTVVGGGAAAGTALSAAQQEGGRYLAASEEQRLRDALRQYGESLRKFESTVVTETEQEEAVEGVSEVIWNPNYCHSVTVLHYEILRHLRVDTELVGVSECLFVPFPITPFAAVDAATFPNGYDVGRIIRHRDALLRGLKDRKLRWVFPYLEDYANDFEDGSVPAGRRVDQQVVTLRGSIDLKLAIASPLKGDEDARALEEAVDADADDKEVIGHALIVAGLIATAFGPFPALLGIGAGSAGATLAAAAAKERERLFDEEIAPTMARRFLENLELKAGSQVIEADFTFAGTYRKGRTHRVHFQVSRKVLEDAGLTRANLEGLIVSVDEDLLPPNSSVAVITAARIQVGTETYRKTFIDNGVRDDLLAFATGQSAARAASESAVLSFPATNWEKENVQEIIRKEVERLVKHLDNDLFYYHRSIWLDMDPGEIYTILDGYTVSATDPRSLASVLEYRPIAIVGNSLVFRVARGSFVGVNGFASLDEARALYQPQERVSDPIRVSLPTGGLYSQTLMDPCNACEEHYGSTDWVLEEEELLPQELDSSLLGSRRQRPQGLAPSQLPSTLINLQNTPTPPAPSGLGGALEAVTKGNAFRDMAGLEGTQVNARAAMEAAAKLASQFGGLAAKQIDAERAATTRLNNDPSLTDSDREKIKRHLDSPAEHPGQPQRNPIVDQVDRASSPEMEVEVEQTGGETPTTKTTVKKRPLEGTVATGEEGMTLGEPGLRGSDDGPLDLQQRMINHLLSKPSTGGRSCVAFSLHNFHTVCAAAGCATREIPLRGGGALQIPLIEGPEGVVDPHLFYRLWFSTQGAGWTSLPPAARGGGGAGALLSAGLADGPLLHSANGWPQGLKPGAVLQLWRDEQTYRDVMAGTASSPDGDPIGHSLIFIAYLSDRSNEIYVSDQRKSEEGEEYTDGYALRYGAMGFRYVVGANLRRAELTGVGADLPEVGEVDGAGVPQTVGMPTPETMDRYPNSYAVMAELMSQPKASQFGQRTIKTGDVYGGLMVVEPLPTQVVYFDEAVSELRMTNYEHFFQMVNVGAFAEGGSRAAWLEEVARIEFEFMVAALFGFKASLAIGVLRVMAALNQHPQATKLIVKHFKLIYDALYWFVTRHPRFAVCLLSEATVATVTSTSGSVDRLKPHQLAHLFGALLRGNGSAALSENVLLGMAKATAGALASFTALKLLPAATAEAIDAKAAEMKTRLANQQLPVNLDCLKEGLRDLLAERDAAEVEAELTTLAEKAQELHDQLKVVLADM